MGNLSRLRRDSRGSVLIELAAGVFLLMLFAIGMAHYALLEIDIERDGRATMSGMDLARLLEEDVVGTPSKADADRIAGAIAMVSGADADDYRVHFSVFGANSSGTPTLYWTRTSGSRLDYAPASQVSFDGTSVVVRGAALEIRDDEKLVVVELLRTGRGLGLNGAGPTTYSVGTTYMEDTVLGP